MIARVRCFALLIGLFASITAVAGQEPVDTSVIPMGRSSFAKGTEELTYRLPRSTTGPIACPIVFIASQPWMEGAPATPLADPASGDATVKIQVPGTVRITIAGQELPSWELETFPTAFVINLAAITSNPNYAKGMLSLKVEFETEAEGVNIGVLGMPDPLLLNESYSGPLFDFADVAKDEAVRQYFTAMRFEIAGDKQPARDIYEKLVESDNAGVARFARRCLRLLNYDLRKYKLSGNFNENRRWGLYLDQCGFYAPAFDAYNECRVIYPPDGDSQFRAAEMMDRRGGSVSDVTAFITRSIAASRIMDPVEWHILFVILHAREDQQLSNDQIGQIKDDWYFAERMITAASGGRVQTYTAFFDMRNEGRFPLRSYADKAIGPDASIVRERGWFDLVIFVRPRLTQEADQAPTHVVFADEGPNGACLMDVFPDARWPDLLSAWNRCIAWCFETSEAGPVPPLVDAAMGCGQENPPHAGYALRAALRYHIPPEMQRAPKVCDLVEPDAYLQLWQIEGPFAVPAQEGNQAAPRVGNVMAALPAETPASATHIIHDGEFVDLKQLFPDAGPALARATTWVYSPRDQNVRMWIGQNDGASIWLNGECIRGGAYYSQGEFADRNLASTIATVAPLKTGWNEIQLIVESLPAPLDSGWGFSVALCGWWNQPLPGLACVNRRPETDVVEKTRPAPLGTHFAWADVKDDFWRLLPRLSTGDLQELSGIRDLTMQGSINGAVGHVALLSPSRAEDATYRSLTTAWRDGEDHDYTFNNVLNWEREGTLAIRYTKDGRPRDLLLVRPEAAEPFITLLRESAEAERTFNGEAAQNRLLGYVLVPAGGETVTLFAIDTLLGDGGVWPMDEDDLLNPISDEYILNRTLFPELAAVPTTSPPAAAEVRTDDE